jgi:hypothetical protein
MTGTRRKREFTRVFAAIAVDLLAADGERVRGELRDLSARGLRLACDRSLAPGMDCRIVLHPHDTGEELTIETRGTIVRAGENELALLLSEVPYEEFARLRGFLLRHANDPEEIAEELAERLGLAPDA